MHAKPNFALTPGCLCTASDPDFHEYRYAEHIPYCKCNGTSSWGTTVLNRYNIPLADRNKYKIVHIIPIACGGSNSLDNLWPQPTAEADDKARLDNQLYLRLCAGSTTQAEVVREIYSWFNR
jgi:hypothetical protein